MVENIMFEKEKKLYDISEGNFFKPGIHLSGVCG